MTLTIAHFIGWFLAALGFTLYVQCAFGQTIMIAPDGMPTYVYPGTSTAPAIVIPPSGMPTYVYPGNSPAAPLAGLPSPRSPASPRPPAPPSSPVLK